MESDQVFTVHGSTAERATKVSLGAHFLHERGDLQEWVKKHPELLGEELLVVTEEFDRWRTASGDRAADRLDILALDRTGRLVVAELKRHRAPDTVLVQALNYAAMASRFTVDELVEAHSRFLVEQGVRPPDGSDPLDHARAHLEGWAQELSDTTLGPPRIVLVAEDFGAVLTNTSMFLLEQGMDLRLVRLGLHELPGSTLALTTSQVLPVQRAEDFMIRPGSTPARRTNTGVAARRGPIIDRLVDAGALEEGAPLSIVVPPVKNLDRLEIQRWLDQDPARSRVRWRNDREKPFVWEGDGFAWAMKPLIREIVRRATGVEGDVWGPNWYLTGDGRALNKIAEDVSRADQGDDS
ncbi:hypothetical protein GCM10023200_58660 [Actinomycetospora chlora]|uniref:DUF91 domain-containing protein n=1 Tax=Actinomycetospora chlora TaxID=663608 RepID=A0ABP9CR99_9PSEU